MSTQTPSDSKLAGRQSRRDLVKRGSTAGLGAALLGTSAVAGSHARLQGTPSSGDGVQGGTLNVALVGEPPSLDVHQSTATITAFVMWNVYEPLFTLDRDFGIIPMLAEEHEVGEDGLSHVVRLRQGVPFHNGEEMLAADVIASVFRWGELSSLGQDLLAATDEIVEVDEYTVEFRMKQPFGAFLQVLGHNIQSPAIYPKSVIDAAGGEQITEFIGTGPYRLAERQPDRFIRLERFEEYAALQGEPNGYGGHKYQYLDQMMFMPVPDEAARVAGLQAGDYHFLESISADQAEALSDDANLVVERLPPNGWATFMVNHESPLMSNIQMRQAVQAALDHEPILRAGSGDLYRLDPGVMLAETVWHTTAGEELYNRNDPDTARALLEEAGYDGTPIRWVTTQEYQNHYNWSVVGRQQLEQAGFVVDLQVYDWATVIEYQGNPELWDINTTGISFKPDPTMVFVMQLCTAAGFWCSDDATALLDQLQTESEFEVRYELWEQLHQLFYEEVGAIKLGDTYLVGARSSAMQGLVPQTQLGPILWNVWLEQ